MEKKKLLSIGGRLIFEAAVETTLSLVLAALAGGADLCGADLCGADLRRADLCGADLRRPLVQRVRGTRSFLQPPQK